MNWLIAVSISCCCSLLFLRWLLRRKRFNISGKTILITGASSGLGEALARRLFNKQCQLILLARRIDRLESLCQELLQLHPSYPKPKTIQIDLSNFEQISSCSSLNNILQHDSIDCLINNAGISQRSSVLDTSIDIVNDIFRLNYLSLVTLTKLVLTKIIERKQKNATIVNISSLQGLIAVPERSSYAASKHAVQAFSDSLRMELKEEYPEQNINICVVSPSYIRTELGQQAFSRMNKDEKSSDDNISKGYEADYVAERIIKAIEYRENDVVIAPFVQYLAIWLRRLWPTGYFRMMVARNKRLKAKK
ncbi:unnamed protein product [Adineta steineri]|uniref:Uncharacterized protein n=1 Tax=Adineta steineri TaxID=433720 RepID=A0A819ASI8_9BILA|nr:unnamed protein product [Adineta steineri]CAF3788867.1 unnamed protein product [Adineta steineri]